jgi:SAM-dependent methyltransferase
VDWRVKGIVQGMLSVAPLGTEMNNWLQHHLGELRNFDNHVVTRIADWTGLISLMADIGLNPAGLDYVEIGTGWIPTLPVCFSLARARSCVTIDLERHLDSRLTFQMLQTLSAHVKTIADTARQDYLETQSRYEALHYARSMVELLCRAGIEFTLSTGTRMAQVQSETIDVIYSNNVMEHVPLAQMLPLFMEFKRTLRPGGVAIHAIACNDHYAHFDDGITQLNYLRYADRQWQRWNNRLQFQNRLRPCDFVNVTAAAGLRLLGCEYYTPSDLVQWVQEQTIAPEFSKYPTRELATTSFALVAGKP